MPKKHFIIVGDITNGIIIDKDGELFPHFKTFVDHTIARKFSYNTVKVYAEHVFRFLNYFYRASELTTSPLNKHQLRLIIHSYSSYLLHGIDSDNEIAQKIAKENNRQNKTKISSLGPIDNAISYFIRLGELEHSEDAEQDIPPLFKTIKVTRSKAEKANILENSVLAGVLRGGLTSSERISYGISSFAVRGRRSKQPRSYTKRSIELAKIGKVIDSASNLRDKTLYALLAASGCRTHEALQVRIEDIDINAKEVFLKSPFEVDRNLLGLTPAEEKLLCWKGRSTPTTFLIEPFKSMFFKYLKQYVKEERISTCGHTFVFQNYTNFRPHFCSDRSSRIKQFKATLKRAGIEDTSDLGPHSLRHSYGFYALNYLPVSDKVFGLPLAYVQTLMGHASISSTKIYAIHDEEITKEIVNQANQQMFNGSPIDTFETLIKFYQNKISDIREQLKAYYLSEGKRFDV